MNNERQRQKELRDPEVTKLLTHWLFDATVDATTRPNHRVLDGAIAPVDWPGWDQLAPPLGKGCRCAISGITAGRARRMIESGEGFDLTQGVPAGAGFDVGWTNQLRDSDDALEPDESEADTMPAYESKLLDLFRSIEPVICETPGVLQTELYRKLSEIPRSDLSYALYLAEKEGRLTRRKKGRSYELSLPAIGSGNAG